MVLTLAEYDVSAAAHESRVEILGFDLGYKMTRRIFRLLQATKIIAKT